MAEAIGARFAFARPRAARTLPRAAPNFRSVVHALDARTSRRVFRSEPPEVDRPPRAPAASPTASSFRRVPNTAPMSSSVSCPGVAPRERASRGHLRACRAFAPARAAILAPARRVSTFRVSAAADSSFLTAGGGGDDEPALTEEEITLRDVTRKLVDCRRRKAAANAVDLLVSLGRAGVEPDLFAATTCLGACVAAGKQDLALKVFEEVFANGVVEPDEVVFVELMRGHLDVNPPEWSRVNALIGKMENTFDVVPTAATITFSSGSAPTITSSNARRTSWTGWRTTAWSRTDGRSAR